MFSRTGPMALLRAAGALLCTCLADSNPDVSPQIFKYILPALLLSPPGVLKNTPGAGANPENKTLVVDLPLRDVRPICVLRGLASPIVDRKSPY